MAEPNWPKLSPGITVWRSENALEFLTALRRSNNYWWEGESIPWVFRGHRDESWPLLPSAWRPGDRVISNAKAEATKRFEKISPAQRTNWAFGNHYTGQTRFGENDPELLKRLTIEATAELLPVYDFLLTCDRLGLSTPIVQLPPDPTLSPDWLIGASDPLVGDDFFRFADIPHYIALAQHHGLPTRLLDWTHDPVKAAFFAAGELIDEQAGTDIAVWAIHRQRAELVKGKPAIFPRIYDGNIENGDNHDGIHPSVQIVRTPMRENFFLAAQSGQFTSISASGIDFMNRGGARPPLEVFVAECGIEDAVLRKMVLDKRCVPELARMLDREEISRSQLMPTHDNVASDVKTKWRARTVFSD
jgi:hypothetical protein